MQPDEATGKNTTLDFSNFLTIHPERMNWNMLYWRECVEYKKNTKFIKGRKGNEGISKKNVLFIFNEQYIWMLVIDHSQFFGKTEVELKECRTKMAKCSILQSQWPDKIKLVHLKSFVSIIPKSTQLFLHL